MIIKDTYNAYKERPSQQKCEIKAMPFDIKLFKKYGYFKLKEMGYDGVIERLKKSGIITEEQNAI